MGHLQKEGLRPNPETPKTILDCNSAYKLRTKTAELPKLRTFKVCAPTSPSSIDVLSIIYGLIFVILVCFKIGCWEFNIVGDM